MYPTWSFVRINATYINRIPSGGVSYAPFRHFVLLKKYIVYGQGPIACKCDDLGCCLFYGSDSIVFGSLIVVASIMLGIVLVFVL